MEGVVGGAAFCGLCSLLRCIWISLSSDSIVHVCPFLRRVSAGGRLPRRKRACVFRERRSGVEQVFASCITVRNTTNRATRLSSRLIHRISSCSCATWGCSRILPAWMLCGICCWIGRISISARSMRTTLRRSWWRAACAILHLIGMPFSIAPGNWESLILRLKARTIARCRSRSSRANHTDGIASLQNA